MPKPLVNNTIHAGSHVRVFVPEKQLGVNSIKIEANNKSRFSEWTKLEDQETYDSIQRVIAFWKETGIADDYMIYAKEVTDSTEKFAYEIVPYKKSCWHKVFKQLRVLWNVVFGGKTVSQKENDRIVKAYQIKSDTFTAPIAVKSAVDKVSKCPFCKPEVINKQWIYNRHDDPTVVVYNYAPISQGKDKHHFMVITKEHRPRFEDVTQEEFAAASANTRRLAKHYQTSGYNTLYFHSKVGIAGETVSHWHQHVIPAESKFKQLLGKINVFFRTIFGARKMSDKELKQKVEHYRQELNQRNIVLIGTRSEPAKQFSELSDKLVKVGHKVTAIVSEDNKMLFSNAASVKTIDFANEQGVLDEVTKVCQDADTIITDMDDPIDVNIHTKVEEFNTSAHRTKSDRVRHYCYISNPEAHVASPSDTAEKVIKVADGVIYANMKLDQANKEKLEKSSTKHFFGLVIQENWTENLAAILN